MSEQLEEILNDYGLKRQDLDCKCERQIRDRIADEIVDDWNHVGRTLDVSESKLTAIINDNVTLPRPQDKAVRMLDVWSEEYGGKATCLKLAEALLSRKKRKVVEILCEEISNQKNKAPGAGSHQQDTERNDEEPPSKKPRKFEGENSSNSKKISAQYNGTTYTFVEAVPEYLRCNKCRKLPVDPHRAHCLLFCELCIKRHRQSCLDSNCGIHEPPTKKQIKDLKIKCPNSALGCEWVGLLRESGDHRLVCLKEKVPCTYSDIGCTDEMLREELKDHEDKDRTKHLDFAMITITKMKKTDDTIRTEMINLQDLFRKKLEEQKTRHDKAIERLRQEISQCPPLIAKMTNHSGYPEPLSVFDLVNNSKVFTSSSFYSHPQGYKLCLVLKCCRSNPQLNDEKKDLTVKLKISALFQDPESSLSWPYKGVAIVTLQPEGLKASQLSVDFDITAPPSDSSTDHIVSEPGFSDHNLPQEWRDSTSGLTPRNLTLKIEKIDIIRY